MEKFIITGQVLNDVYAYLGTQPAEKVEQMRAMLRAVVNHRYIEPQGKGETPVDKKKK